MSNFEISKKITSIIAGGRKHYVRKGQIVVEFCISVCGNPLARIYRYRDSRLIKTCRGNSDSSIKEVTGFVRSVLDAF